MNYSLTFTPEEMQIISDALVALPFKIAAPLINNINAQIKAAEVAHE